MLYRLKPHDETDLRWFFCDSDGTLGMRSLYPAMIERHLSGGGKNSVPNFDPGEHMLEAALRARKISRALCVLTEQHSSTLKYVYGPLEYSAILYPDFRLFAGIAARTLVAQQEYASAAVDDKPTDWLVALALKSRAANAPKRVRDLMQEIRAEAEVLLAGASKTYALARERAPRMRMAS